MTLTAALPGRLALDPIAAAWHPVGWLADLEPDRPLGFRLLGRSLVAFRDAAGAPVVLDARCPHRGTSLALGAVREGALACPYHAWRFGTGGTCTAIPSLPEGTPIPPGAAATALPAIERDGMVWTSLGPADAATVPALPEPGHHADRVLRGEPLVWRTSAGRHVENILDLAHFPFVHPATFGCAEAERVEAHEVVHRPGAIAYDVGVTTANPEVPGGGRLYPQLGPLIRLGYRYAVDLPYRVTLEFAFPDGLRRALHEVVRPDAPDACTVFWLLCVDGRLTSPDDEELAFAERVFTEDRPVVESQPPGVPVSARAEVHVPADRLAVGYRRAMREWGVAEGARV